MPIPLSKFEQIARLVVDRAEAQAQLDRYSRANAFSVYISDNGTASESVPDPLVAKFRNDLVEYAKAELASVDDALRALDIDPEA